MVTGRVRPVEAQPDGDGDQQTHDDGGFQRPEFPAPFVRLRPGKKKFAQPIHGMRSKRASLLTQAPLSGHQREAEGIDLSLAPAQRSGVPNNLPFSFPFNDVRWRESWSAVKSGR